MSVLRQILRRFSSTGSRAEAELARVMLGADEFRTILEYERMRADRNGWSFSLLVVTPRDSVDAPARLLDLARRVRQRLRKTDLLGAFGPRSLGILLLDTAAPGAEKAADELLNVVGHDAVEATLFVYPMQWHGDADGAKDHGVAAENSTDEAANDDSSNDKPRDDDLDSPQGRDGADCNSSADRSRVSCKREPAELLFVRPFPAWKRAIDVVGALVGLVLLSPVMAVAALAIKLTSPGPILFRQLRAGLGGQPFTIFKFRTMRVDAEALKPALRAHSEQDGPAFKLSNDPRVTRLGKWLRSSCVDELPQLWNVLIGDMSLVGPRPLPCDESAACVRWQQHRLRVRPGLTCIWQTHRDNSIPFDDWMRMDIRYMRETSLWQDLKLVVQTIASILVPALRPRLGSTQTSVTRHGLPRSTN